jgi:hypothetical protein
MEEKRPTMRGKETYNERKRDLHTFKVVKNMEELVVRELISLPCTYICKDTGHICKDTGHISSH